jgi:CheY-like chemotaxis protein
MKILLMDDDPLFHKIMSASLARKEREIIFAFDGEEAIKKSARK